MRPEKAKRIIQISINRALKDKSVYHIKSVLNEISQLRKKAYKEEGLDIATTVEDDTPENSDGYNIKNPSWNTLMYISDRFTTSYRLDWLYYLALSDEKLFIE